MNRKRVQRLWREEGLRVRPYAMKRRRVGTSTVPSKRLRAERRNQVWALDFIFDSTADGRPIKALTMCDEHTRESVGRQLGRSITADDVVAVLEQARAERGAPEYLRMDNGPELVATALRAWCRRSGTGTLYIEPGSPWENPFVESFNARLRDELFNREIFLSVFEAKVLYFDWCDVYNKFRPHSSIGYLAPSMIAPKSLSAEVARKKRAATMPQDARNEVAVTHNTWSAAARRNLQWFWLARSRHPAAAPAAVVIQIREPSQRVDPLLGVRSGG